MNLTLRTRIFVIVSIILLLILAISIAITVFSNKKTETENQPTNTQDGQEQQIFDGQNGVLINNDDFSVIDANTPIAQMNSEEKIKSAAQNIAKIFVERYGSYSTDNPGQNLKDLEVLSTADLWKVLKSRIENMTVGEDFIGFTTRAFSSSITSFEEDKIIIRVISAREENKNGDIRNFNQEAEVAVIKSGDVWLVDDVKWK